MARRSFKEGRDRCSKTSEANIICCILILYVEEKCGDITQTQWLLTFF